MSPAPPAQRVPLGRTGLLFLESLALSAEPVDSVEHSIQQGFGRGGGYSGTLELLDLSALPMNLQAHVLDLGPNKFDIWHLWSRLGGKLDQVAIRTK
jgi:hypothetical protein